MAYVSTHWGCFIHIPKTGGLWIKMCLKQLEEGPGNDGYTHGLPKRWYTFDRYWAVVRDPVDWWRSVYAHRGRMRWADHNKEVPWKNFCELLKPYESYDDFPGFIEQVTTNLPGLAGWLFGCHTPPPVEVYITGSEKLYDFLRSLGCDPDGQPPHNTAPERGIGSLPDMTDDLAQMIRKSEKAVYERYFE